MSEPVTLAAVHELYHALRSGALYAWTLRVPHGLLTLVVLGDWSKSLSSRIGAAFGLAFEHGRNLASFAVMYVLPRSSSAWAGSSPPLTDMSDMVPRDRSPAMSVS